jgi:hypothetical protein
MSSSIAVALGRGRRGLAPTYFRRSVGKNPLVGEEVGQTPREAKPVRFPLDS